MDGIILHGVVGVCLALFIAVVYVYQDGIKRDEELPVIKMTTEDSKASILQGHNEYTFSSNTPSYNKRNNYNGKDFNKVIYEACGNGKLDKLEYLIKTYPYLLHSVDNDGWNAALHAARGGNVKVLQLLIHNKVDVKHKNNLGWNIVHVASHYSKLDMIRYIIQTNLENLHSVDYAGFNAVLHATIGGNIKILRLLVDNGVDIKPENILGMTILHIACLLSTLEMNRYIIHTYPDLLHSVDNDGFNAALHAARRGNLRILQLLTENKVNIKHENINRWNILHVTCQNSNLEMSRYIIQKYPDLLHSVDNDGSNAALHAARGGDVKILQLLTGNNVDIKPKNINRWNLLHVACQYANLEMSRYIIQKYPDFLHSVDSDGWNTALHAARGGNVKILQLLIDNKVDIKQKNINRWNILHVACIYSNLEMSHYIINTYPDLLHSVSKDGWNTALHAAQGGNVKILQLLNENKFDIKQENINRWNILHVACIYSQLEMSRYIIKTYPYLLYSVDNKGWNAALHAARGGSVEMLKLLIYNGGDIKHKSDVAWNILHVACMAANLKMSRYIIKTYPDLLESVDNNGWNVALHAARGGNVEILQLITENKVNIKHKSRTGWNILHVACQYSNLEMSHYIIQTFPDLLHSVDNEGWNAALHAALGGNNEILILLTDNKVDIKHKANHGWNILHMACQHSNIEMSRYIIKTYPDLLHSVDNENWNAALHAARGGNVKILQLLTDNEVDVKYKSNHGLTILHVACAFSNLEMSRFIIQTYPNLLHIVDNQGKSAAFFAVQGKNPKVLQLLADHGV